MEKIIKSGTIYKIIWVITCIIIIIASAQWIYKHFKEDSDYYESIVISYQEVNMKNQFDEAEKQVKLWSTLNKRYPEDKLIKEQLVIWKFNEIFYIRQIDEIFKKKD